MTKTKGLPRTHRSKGTNAFVCQVSVRLTQNQLDGLNAMIEDYAKRPGYPPLKAADLIRWGVKELLEKHRQSRGHSLANPAS